MDEFAHALTWKNLETALNILSKQEVQPTVAAFTESPGQHANH